MSPPPPPPSSILKTIPLLLPPTTNTQSTYNLARMKYPFELATWKKIRLTREIKREEIEQIKKKGQKTTLSEGEEEEENNNDDDERKTAGKKEKLKSPTEMADESIIAPFGALRQARKNIFKKKTYIHRPDDREDRKIRRTESKPLVLADENFKHEYTGSLEGGLTSNYVLFSYDESHKAFVMIPIENLYKFTPRPSYKTLNIDEAEEIMSKKKKENDRWLMRTREQALNNGIDIPIIKEEPTSSRKVKVEEGADEELDFNDTFADDEGDFGDVFKEEGDREEHKPPRTGEEATKHNLDAAGQNLKKALKGADQRLFESDDSDSDPYASTDSNEEEAYTVEVDTTIKVEPGVKPQESIRPKIKKKRRLDEESISSKKSKRAHQHERSPGPGSSSGRLSPAGSNSDSSLLQLSDLVPLFANGPISIRAFTADTTIATALRNDPRNTAVLRKLIAKHTKRSEDRSMLVLKTS